MVLQRFFISSFFLVLMLHANAFPETEKEKGGARGPITVTAETLTADNKARTATFEKNVVAKTPDITLYADTMVVYYDSGTGDVTKIEAGGNVRLTRSTRMITSQNAVYYASEEKVVFTGEPRAVDGENLVTGTTMTYFIREDRSRVEKSKVFLRNKKDG